ncbi:MAG: DUF1467 family protein [Pseudomonadota bacterium]
MGFGTAFAIYFVIWWTTLFVTLPFRARSQATDGHVVEGTDPGAPVTANMGRRMAWNTVVAAGVFALYYLVVHVFGVTVDSLPNLVPERTP